MKLAIFFSSGAFGDCARHAVLHAMASKQVDMIDVYASEKTMPSLDLANWKCGCEADHGAELKSNENSAKVQRIAIDVTDQKEMEDRLDLSGVDAVISGLGNRQMFLGDRCARRGTKNIAAAMKRAGVHHIVAMTSMGVNEDRPCMEWRSEGKFMAGLFNTVSLREYRDLAGMEKDIRAAATQDGSLNYLLVRPVGLGEQCVPRGEYFIQKKKYEDAVGPNMAKSDVGIFLLEQALTPTYEKVAVVIGADPAEAHASFGDAGMEKEVKTTKKEAAVKVEGKKDGEVTARPQ